MHDCPIIIKCRFVPKQFCVNIFGTLWVRDPSWIDNTIINHERIHTRQMLELLVIPFYLIYLMEWLIRLAATQDWYEAYRNISFEQEAYAHGHDLAYLPRRRIFAQWRQPK